MLLLLYIDKKIKQVNSEGETLRPKNGDLKCRRLLSRLTVATWWFAHRAASVSFVFASGGRDKSPLLKYLNTRY